MYFERSIKLLFHSVSTSKLLTTPQSDRLLLTYIILLPFFFPFERIRVYNIFHLIFFFFFIIAYHGRRECNELEISRFKTEYYLEFWFRNQTERKKCCTFSLEDEVLLYKYRPHDLKVQIFRFS